mgnify:CR=1 FL=1
MDTDAVTAFERESVPRAALYLWTSRRMMAPGQKNGAAPGTF